jgi:hypothetical protein
MSVDISSAAVNKYVPWIIRVKNTASRYLQALVVPLYPLAASQYHHQSFGEMHLSHIETENVCALRGRGRF